MNTAGVDCGEQGKATELGFSGRSPCLTELSSREELNPQQGTCLCGTITMNERPVLFSTCLA